MSGIEKRLECSSILEVHKRLLERFEDKKSQHNLSRVDEHLLKKNHKFLWENSDNDDLTWEEELAKKYYDKLFKEFCICDLSKYKENKVALRWRTKTEVISGKGQFVCSEKRCSVEEHLKSWEVNFCYVEKNEKKNALVKIKLCPECSGKLNYYSKKKQIKRLKKGPKKQKKNNDEKDVKSVKTRGESEKIGENSEDIGETMSDLPWTKNVDEAEFKTREEEMEEYLNELLF